MHGLGSWDRVGATTPQDKAWRQDLKAFGGIEG